MKHSLTAVACSAALVASLAACGGGDNKAGEPIQTGGSSPSTTATPRPMTTAPTATTIGPVPLAAHSTYAYGGLTFVVNLPADIPSASRSSMRSFSEFLQGVGRTTANNKLDPSLSGLASQDVVKYVQTSIVPTSVQGIGSVAYSVNSVRTIPNGPTLISGCLDQSHLVQVRKDGTHFVAGAKKYPTLKMKAHMNRGMTDLLTFTVGAC